MKQSGYYLYPLGGGVQRGGDSSPTARIQRNFTGRILYSEIATSAAIANTAALTNFDHIATVTTGLLNVTGAVLSIECGGSYGTTGTPGILLNIIWFPGLDVINNVQFVATPNNQIGAGWSLKGGLVVRVTGAAGTYRPLNPTFIMANNTTLLAQTNCVHTTTITPFDFTAANTIMVQAQWTAADPANTISMEYLIVRIDYPRFAN